MSSLPTFRISGGELTISAKMPYLDVRVLTRDDILGPRAEEFARVFLDPKQQRLADFKGKEDLLRRADPSFGAIFYGLDRNERIVITGQGLRGNEPARNIEDAKEGKFSVPGGKVATLYSIVNHPGAEKNLMMPFVIAMLGFVQKPENGIKEIYTLSPMHDFREWFKNLSNVFLVESGLSRIVGPSWKAFQDKVLRAPTLQALSEMKEFWTLNKFAAHYIATVIKGKESETVALSNVVARHARIGAEVDDLYPLADPKGICRSLGFMMRLKYPMSIDKMNANSVKFNHAILERSPAIDALLSVKGTFSTIPVLDQQHNTVS